MDIKINWRFLIYNLPYMYNYKWISKIDILIFEDIHRNNHTPRHFFSHKNQKMWYCFFGFFVFLLFYKLLFILMKTIILYYNIVDKQDFSYFQKKLEGYKFPVYTTAFCPRNETEWKIRSSFLNCTTRNGYTCLPNKNLTELLEFCFKRPFIWIQEGIN